MKKSFDKRQTAETLLNRNSSRSHCVFIITIHTKEPRPASDDLIKTGKLFLVDLAGSECVGKSGAVQLRAKEAGKINQSLLTLGRVINALVEKTGYVPYRDSKLTRLLQESLGGRSKTVIIATVSPSNDCMEETLNTLDYAHRAKNIRNRPQVNQKMTRKAYMRELLIEINDLKRENEVLREKNGIFLAPEKWANLKGDLTQKTQRLEEVNTLLKAKIQEYDELQTLQNNTVTELEETKTQKESVELSFKKQSSVLKSTEQKLSQTQFNLDETQYIVGEQKKTEEELFRQASSVKTTLEHTIEKNDKLHEKIIRKSAVESHNKDASQTFQSSFSKDLNSVQKQLDTFCQNQQNTYIKFDYHIRETMAKKKKELSDLVEISDGLARSVKSSQDFIVQLCSRYQKETIENFENNINGCINHQEKMKEELNQSQTNLKSFVDKLQLKLQREEESINEWKTSMTSLLDSSITRVNIFVEETNKKIDDIQQLLKQNADMQVSNLTSSQNMVDLQLKQQKESINSKMTSFMEEVQVLCSKFQESQEKEINCDAAEMKKSFQNQIDEIMSGSSQAITLSNQLKNSANKFHEEHKPTHASTLEIIHRGVQERKQHSDACHNDIVTIHKSMTDQFDHIVKNNDNEICLAQKRKIQNTNCVETFVKEVDLGLQNLEKKSAQQIKIHNEASSKIQTELESHSSDWSNKISNHQKANTSYKDEQSKQLQQLQHQLQHFIDALKVDKPTGTTPVKAPINIPASFVRTEEHSKLLDKRRKTILPPVTDAHESTDENTPKVSHVEQPKDETSKESSPSTTKLPSPTAIKSSAPVKKPVVKRNSLTESQIPVLSSINRFDYKPSEKRKKKKKEGSKNVYNKSNKGNKTQRSKIAVSNSRLKRMRTDSRITSIEKFPR